MKDSPDTPQSDGIPEVVKRHQEETPAVFSPPPGSRFFIGADFDGNDASYIAVPGSKPGYTRLLARDGSPATRLTSAGAMDVSREEFEASAGAENKTGSKMSNAPSIAKSPWFKAYETENGEAAVISSDFAMRMSDDGFWKPGGFSAVEGMEKFASVADSAKATALFHDAEAAHQSLQKRTVTQKDFSPTPESLTPVILAKWEQGPCWQMIWDHYRWEETATLLAWLEKGEMWVRQKLVEKTQALVRAWTERGVEPEHLIEAFQSLYPVTGDEMERLEPPPLPSEAVDRLQMVYDVAKDTFTPEELRDIFAPEEVPSWAAKE